MADSSSGLLQLEPPTQTVTSPVSGGILNQIGNTTPPNTTGPVPTSEVPPVSTYTPAQAPGVTAGATGYTPTPYVVPDKGTVQNQLSDILAKGSPLLTLADTKAKSDMNSVGLLDSSIAQGARENAVIAAALPIAQQDASSFNAAMTKTADAANAASAASAQAVNNASTTNAQLLTSLNSTNANAINNALSATQQQQNQRSLQLISSNTQTVLANLQAQNQQLLQTNVNAANGFSQLIQQIATIQNSSTLDSATKEQNVQSLINNFNQFLKTTAAIASTNQAAVTGLNLDQYFSNPSFTPTGGTPTTSPTTGTPPTGTLTNGTAVPKSAIDAGQVIDYGNGNGTWTDPTTNITYGVINSGGQWLING